MDSRDLQERIEELESDFQDMYKEFLQETEQTEDDVTYNEWYDNHKSEEKKELEELEEFKRDVCSREWDYGIYFILDEDFTDYAMEMLQDIGALPQNVTHYIVIDKEATADNIKKDYSWADFQGDTYWYRG